MYTGYYISDVYLIHHVQCRDHTVDVRLQGDSVLQGEWRRGGGGGSCVIGRGEQLQGRHRVEQLGVNGLLQPLPCRLGVLRDGSKEMFLFSFTR